MGAIYYKGQKYGAMPASAANLPYEAGSQDSTKDKIDANAAAIATKQDLLTVENVSSQVTLETGFTLKSWGYIKAYRYGKIVQINVFGFTADTAVSSAKNFLSTTFNMLTESSGIVNVANSVTSVRVGSANKIVIEDPVAANTNSFAVITVFIA